MEHFNPSLPARFPEKAICTNGKPSIGGAQPQQMLLESFPVETATWKVLYALGLKKFKEYRLMVEDVSNVMACLCWKRWKGVAVGKLLTQVLTRSDLGIPGGVLLSPF